MRSNPLLKWLLIPMALLLVFVGIKLFSGAPGGQPAPKGAASTLTPEEMKALGIAGDTPRDTVATLVAQVKQLRTELQSALGDNKQHKAENERLRALLELRPALQVRSIPAEVLYEAADPFSRKLFIDRGATHGVVLGAPVLVPEGVLGQVTRVFPLSSQVTLLIDKDAAIPVLNARTQARSAAFGGAGGDAMELRYMAANADVQVGDQLNTSGVDGVYPPGLAVARVAAVERRAESGFARILLAPNAAADGVRHVLVLEPVGLQQPPREAAADTPAATDRPERAGKPDRPGRGPRR